MKTAWNLSALLLLPLLALPSMELLAKEVTFKEEGTKNVACACIVSTSGCRSRIFDAVAGSSRHTWVQHIHVKPRMTLDLTQVCYRKRDVSKLGEGLCCSASSETETLRKFFSGELQN